MEPTKMTAPCHMENTIHFQKTLKLKYAWAWPA